eukprot:TRINITY_DN2941_c0_g1_i4.p1 TRINITY_DN2941_c0_g1~~TRINITY_DN2941_c0_g1_i4.p1  ORF type:complete len:436 (+),score=88.38 TRINITY_DN2941_c0_g1_i4:78-1385(+)
MASLKANVEALNAKSTPVQTTVNGFQSCHLGWGSHPQYNLACRQAIGKPGPPFGGMGFFDPQTADLQKCNAEQRDALQAILNEKLTFKIVRDVKLAQFEAQASEKESIYVWVFQPIYNCKGEVVAAESLLRVKNGSDSAPFEDVLQLCDPEAPEDVKIRYAKWKVAELKHALEQVKEHEKLQALCISVNFRPADMHPAGPVYKELTTKYLPSLSDAEKRLMTQVLAIEVTEDQKHSPEICTHLEAWRRLGFSLRFDDAIGDLACKALKQGEHENFFHTTSVLTPLLKLFQGVKVDIDWAGSIFLCHPAFFSEQKKKEVLRLAQESDRVTLPRGGPAEGVSHQKLVDEFRTWALEMVEREKPICVECTVREDDPNCAYVLNMLKRMEPPLDIFGAHQKWFSFQGGLTKAKAFIPRVLAENVEECTQSPKTGRKGGS